MSTNLTIHPHSLPEGSSVTFRSSSFFSCNPQTAKLPSPSQVLARKSAGSHAGGKFSHGPVFFHELGLAVKYGKGPEVTIAEGQSLWAIRRYLPRVPVPEIYGWTEDGDLTFIYMELMPGVTLEKHWASLVEGERTAICEELKGVISELRSLRQDPNNQFIGMFKANLKYSLQTNLLFGDINHGPLGDRVFTDGIPPPRKHGPFASVSQLHDWFSAKFKEPAKIHRPGVPLEDLLDPYREMLPDDSPITFTHADLNPVNILVSQDSPCRLIAIIDWEQSGWYPEYWEVAKAEFTTWPDGEWQTDYLPLFLNRPDCIDAFNAYTHALGCF